MGDTANGAANAHQEQPHDFDALGDYGRQVYHDAAALAATLRDATDAVERYLTAQVEQRPFSTLGVAAGLGYVLGGGLSSRLTVVLLGAATRVATALVARELGARMVRSGAAQDETS
jgi:ElaB/YqjD/DUF883 family membrane-anchored ribosome-binding protein